MSDFTKEELKKIHNCIWATISEYNDNEENSLEKFADKIKLMIDNYCPHEGKKRAWGCCTQCEDCGERI